MGKDAANKTRKNKRFKLSNFSYLVLDCEKDNRFIQVNFMYLCNKKPIVLYIYYPKGFCKSKNKYIDKAKEYIHTIRSNGEIYDYCEAYLNKKPYTLKTPFNYGNFSLTDVKDSPLIKANVDNKVPQGPTSNGRKIALALTSLVAVTGTALAVYFYLTRSKGGGSDQVTLTFDLGEGYYKNTKQHLVTKTFKNGVNWGSIKKDAPSSGDITYDDGHHLNTWTIDNQALTDGYVFSKSAEIKANYYVDKINLTISPAGGTWKKAQTGKTVKEDKTWSGDYGTKWSAVVAAVNGVDMDVTPGGLTLNGFKLGDTALNPETEIKVKSTGNINAVYIADANNVAITISSGKGQFSDGSTAYVKTVAKGSTWSVISSGIKEASGEGLIKKGYTLDPTKASPTAIKDTDKFDSSAVVTAYYNVQQLDLKVTSGDGGKFEGGQTEHTATIDYGTKWGSIKNNHTIKTLPNHKVNSGFALSTATATLLSDDYAIKTDKLQIDAQYVDEEKITIKVDLQGGTVSSAYTLEEKLWKDEYTWSQFKNDKLSSLVAPTGKDLSGVKWYNGTTELSDETKLDKDMNIKASWGVDSKYTIAVDPCGCEFASGESKADVRSVQIEHGKTWKDIKESFAMDTTKGSEEGNIFDYIGFTDGSIISDHYVFTGDFTEKLGNNLKAYCKNRDNVSITLNGGEGTFTTQQSHVITIQTPYNTTWNTLKETIKSYPIIRTGYELDKWTTDGSEEPKGPFVTATTLYATWTAKTYDVTVKANGGTWKDGTTGDKTISSVAYGTTWGTAKTGQTLTLDPPSGQKFKYFVVGDATSTNYAIDSYVLTAATTITAVYESDSSTDATLVIDPNGGTFKDDTTTVKFETVTKGTSGTKWSEIKNKFTIKTAPTGYTHDNGKFVDESGATLTGDTTFEKSGIIKADYTATKVTVTLVAGTGGYFSETSETEIKKEIDYNTTYTDDLKPNNNEGYKFAYYTYKDKDDNDVIVDKTYKFTANITLTAHYYVTLTFDAGNYGTITHKTAEVVTGITKWSEISRQYTPTITDSESYKFDTNVYKDSSKTAVTADTKFTKPDKLTAQYVVKLPGDTTTKSLSLDTWTVVANAADKGYTTLSTTEKANGGYKEDFVATTYSDPITKESKTKTANTFVGIERAVEISGVTYKVRIIDENKDDIYDSAKKAALTFEFVSCVGSTGFNTENNNYVGSNLQDYLNKTIYKELPTVLQNSIKPIKKSSYYNGTMTDNIKTNLFVLSAKEIGVSKYPDFDEDVKIENSVYSYYSTGTAEELAIKRTKNKAYWLRSCDINTSMFAWMIGEDGKMGNLYEGSYQPIEITQSLGVAPCFAI